MGVESTLTMQSKDKESVDMESSLVQESHVVKKAQIHQLQALSTAPLASASMEMQCLGSHSSDTSTSTSC